MSIHFGIFLTLILLFILIITISILRLYHKTRLLDYLILLVVLVLLFLVGTMNLVTSNNRSVGILQLRESLLLWAFYLFFLHGIRLRMDSTFREYRVLIRVFFIITLILQVLVIFWKKMDQSNLLYFGIKFKVDQNYVGKGAGIKLLNDYIIYSSGHTFLRDIFVTTISFTLLFSYFTVKPIHPTNRILRAHRIWKFTSSSYFMISIFDSWLWRFTEINPNYAIIFIFSGTIGLVVVSIFYPEAILLSQSQIYRIANLYDLIEKLSSSDQISTRTQELIDYLESLPKNIPNLSTSVRLGD